MALCVVQKLERGKKLIRAGSEGQIKRPKRDLTKAQNRLMLGWGCLMLGGECLMLRTWGYVRLGYVRQNIYCKQKWDFFENRRFGTLDLALRPGPDWFKSVKESD